MAAADVECSLELVIALCWVTRGSEFDWKKGQKSATKAKEGYVIITETVKLISISVAASLNISSLHAVVRFLTHLKYVMFCLPDWLQVYPVVSRSTVVCAYWWRLLKIKHEVTLVNVFLLLPSWPTILKCTGGGYLKY